MPFRTAPRLVHVALLLAALVASPLARTQAQRPQTPSLPAAVDTALFQGIAYRLVGHSRGGRVTSVTGVPAQPRTFYMGVASGGVFRTTDGGRSWTPITDGQIPLGSIGDIAVAPSDPNTLYVGTGSDGVRSNVSTGRGVYKSTDGGATWRFAGLYTVGQIGAVRIHPTDPNTVWVAATGDLFKRSRDRGVYKTTDGGRRWRKVLSVSDSTGAMDVELKPGDPSTVYAWMSRLERKPWTIISGAREGGFYKSTDGGERWTHIRTGLPQGLIGKGNLAVTAANPQRLYALVEAKPGGGLYRSDDAGVTWTQVNSQSALLQRPFYYTTLGADPTNADVVYAGAEGFYKSTDGGRTMAPLRTPHGDNHDIWINPTDGKTMIQANDGGANVSFDGGQTWSTQENQPTAEFYGVTIDRAFPFNLYAAQQDNSTWVIPAFGDPYDVGALRTGPGCETGPIIPHPTDPNIIYGSCKGQYQYLNVAMGQVRNHWVGGQSLYGNPGQELLWRLQRVSPMALSPHDPEVLYYGSQYLHRTRDKGATWETISPDLTAYPPCCQGASGEPITRDVTGEEFFSTLYAITESPLEAGVIWTGANDGPVHVTRDGGRSWRNVTPAGLPWGGRVAWIEASPHRKGSAYAAVYRYLLGDYAPYLYRTDDYGATWTRLTDGTNGIPADWPTRVVREDPDREGLLYAGTEFGMFISFDNGGRWQSFQHNLPRVPINEIKVHDRRLVIATQGRGLWMLDNLSAVQQLTPGLAAEPVHLFRPRDGYRTQAAPGFLGPQLEYWLATAPADAVRLEIVDADGGVVNRYDSSRPPRPLPARRGGDPDDDMMEGRPGRTAAPSGPPLDLLSTGVGLNRFTWSVTHESGLTAPPGRYRARLTVGGATQEVPFTVQMDPRLATEGITEADLRELFTHNRRMRAMVAEVNALVGRARSAEARLTGGTGAAADTLAAVQAVQRQLLTEPVRYGKPGLQAHVSYLASMTARGDQKVGRDALERLARLRTELDAATAALDRALGAAR